MTMKLKKLFFKNKYIFNTLLCSNCFEDHGLRLEAMKIGMQKDELCQNCLEKNGRKLDKKLLYNLSYQYFVKGSLHKVQYGGAPLIQFNEHHYQKTNIQLSNDNLNKDIRLIEEAIKIGFFYYAPRLWMVGEIEPLKSLQDSIRRYSIVQRILAEYPVRVLSENDIFYRLRKSPVNPLSQDEYDSPPKTLPQNGRLDSGQLSVMYGSQDLEICMHECRVTKSDELFLATLSPKKKLKLLDLTSLIQEDVTEFESLDIAIQMLFAEGEHSYEISRDIALVIQAAGFDGLIYPSYFSSIYTGASIIDTAYGISIRKFPAFQEHAESLTIPNLALFGRPIESGLVKINCINRVFLKHVKYDVQLGPGDI